jgi:hypothetical protein
MGGMWELRNISGGPGEAGPRRLWLRENRALVGGVPLTPFARVAAGVDYASPVTNLGDEGMGFINTDVTLYLHRLPVGEWIGYEALGHGATDGVAAGQCNLYDEQGRIGWAAVCALAQSKAPNGAPSRDVPGSATAKSRQSEG